MKTDNNISFGIADDDIWFRKTLISNLCISSRIKVVFCCDNGLNLIEKTIALSPQIILVDLYMPVVSGLEAIKAIREHSIEVKILATSSLFQHDVMHELKKHYVNGYCSRSTSDIKTAFFEILKDQTFFNPEYFDGWIKRGNNVIKRKDAYDNNLTSIEIALLRYSSEGNTNREIANKLNLSNRTVDHYLNRLVHKLNLRNKNELVRFSFENGFCSLHCENSAMGMCGVHSIFKSS